MMKNHHYNCNSLNVATISSIQNHFVLIPPHFSTPLCSLYIQKISPLHLHTTTPHQHWASTHDLLQLYIKWSLDKLFFAVSTVWQVTSHTILYVPLAEFLECIIQDYIIYCTDSFNTLTDHLFELFFNILTDNKYYMIKACFNGIMDWIIHDDMVWCVYWF